MATGLLVARLAVGEYPLMIASVAAGLAFTGPGRYSLDRAFSWQLAGNDWGLAALVISAGAAVLAMLSTRVRSARRPREVTAR